MKEKILKYFEDVNGYYNDCMRYEELSRMLDELIEETKSSLLDKLEGTREKAETKAYFDGQSYGWEEGRKALIDDVMSVFDDFMCGEVDEEGLDTFREMLKDKLESEEMRNGKTET